MTQRRTRSKRPSTPQEAFGRVLQDTRAKKGVSQEKLAFDSGYHPTYISQLERGVKSPSLTTIVALAGALGARGSEMLGRVEVLLGI